MKAALPPIAFSDVVRALFSLRGRMSRKGLLISASVLILIEIVGASLIWIFGFDARSPLVMALKIAFVWIAVAAVCRRLHDLGLSAWRLPTAIALQASWTIILASAMSVSLGIEQMQPGAEGYGFLLAGCVAPVIAATLWLHVCEGQKASNRFGPRPGPLGFSSPGANDPYSSAQAA